MRIAISGKCRSGKDTVADIIISKSKETWTRLSFASALYNCVSNLQSNIGVKVEKDGLLLQTIGEGMRNHYGEKVWVDIVEAYIDAHPLENIIVTDLRYRNELRMLSKRGFKIIRVNRKHRPVDRDPNHISEVDLDHITFEYDINNDNSLDLLEEKVMSVLSKLFEL